MVASALAVSALVAGLVGSIIDTVNTNRTNEMQAKLMREQNAYNSAEAEKGRQFNLDMSNTAYQRSMEDMQKAGLNPILAYQQGGASTISAETAHSATTANLEAPQLAKNVANSVLSAVMIGRMLGSSKAMNAIGFGS